MAGQVRILGVGNWRPDYIPRLNDLRHILLIVNLDSADLRGGRESNLTIGANKR